MQNLSRSVSGIAFSTIGLMPHVFFNCSWCSLSAVIEASAIPFFEATGFSKAFTSCSGCPLSFTNPST